MILIIDNYDSFTFNLYQFVGSINQDVLVKRNDKITVEEIAELKKDQLNAIDVDGRVKVIAGTARSMGVVVEG